MASLEGKHEYRTIVADPPWQFGDKLPGPGRGAAKHYDTMSVEELIAMAPMIDEYAHEHCRLFLWRVASMQREALAVIQAWGFDQPKTEMVWYKLTSGGKRAFGMGRTVRAEHEVCLIAQRGKPWLGNSRTRSTFDAEVELDFEAIAEGHSVKPTKFYDIVNALSPGPTLELFSRRQYADWLCLGNEMSAPVDLRNERASLQYLVVGMTGAVRDDGDVDITSKGVKP